jgi:hypothetical protein
MEPGLLRIGILSAHPIRNTIPEIIIIILKISEILVNLDK